MQNNSVFSVVLVICLLLVGCTNEEGVVGVDTAIDTGIESNEKPITAVTVEEKEEKEEITETTVSEPKEEVPIKATNELFSGYKKIEMDACNASGTRKPNVVVDIGYGDREYFAFTNEYGQLVRVIADEIILQQDQNESVTKAGRYCSDEAKVPGVESEDLDEGHVIADSLGGVSNAYNITPQESTLNRHGDQAYMERIIRDAGGAKNFEAVIAYPNTQTQIPSHYKYTYTIQGHTVVDEFDNINPDKANQSLGLTTQKKTNESKSSTPTVSTEQGDLSSVDTNGNGQVTIQEAKDAGYKMPITREHWLYPYMRDNDNDGLVGE